MSYLDILDEVEIAKGDILDVVSDLLSIMVYCKKNNEKFDANELIDRLQEKVGEEGTIMIRTFSWAFCRGEGFDYNKTPSEVGALGKIAMKRDDFVRTKHPIYSWMVWGKYAKELYEMSNIDSFGVNTPFDFLYVNNAKMLRLGNTNAEGFTHMHHLEQMIGVPYRYNKEFVGKYVDKYNNEKIKKYNMYVRKLECNVKTCTKNYEANWIEKKYMDKKFFNDIEISVLDLRKAYSDVICDIRDNKSRKGVTYKIDNE